MLFLCLGFAVPSTVGSLLLNDVVRDGESIQSPLTKKLTGFAFNQEMSTSAIDHSLIPIKKAFWALTLGIVSHNSKNSTLHHFTNHRLRIVTEWVVDVILVQIGLKCFSMKMTLDLLHEFANTEIFCLFHNCMWQSRHSEVNVYFLALCVNKPTDCPLFTSLPVLIWSASTFSSASLSFWKRSTDTGTQLFTGLIVLTLELSQPNKTPFSISWVSAPDGCSLFTGLSPCLTN